MFDTRWSGWSLFDDSLRREMERLLGAMAAPSTRAAAAQTATPIPVNVYQTADDFVVVAHAPGMDRDAFDVSVHDQSLTVRGRTPEKAPPEGRPVRQERFRGEFTRVVQFGGRVDPEKVDATYRDGMLLVRLAKAAETKPRQISVKTG